MSTKDVCRLCVNTVDLIYIFDKSLSIERPSDVVHITTGVLITEKDEVSQKICSRCYKITQKMFSFRENALKHDKKLKDQLNEFRKNQKMKQPIKRRFKEIVPHNRSLPKDQNAKRTSIEFSPIHPTVADLYRLNQNLKLPSVCLSSNISPVVSITKNYVDEYCKRRKISITNLYQEITKPSEIKNQENQAEGSATEKKKTDLDKPQFIKSLGLTPKLSNSSESPLSVDKQTMLYICSLCNSVQYSAKDLRKHQNHHLVCQFCRCRFRTMEKKNHHVDNVCVVKDAMTRPPVVELMKIELDQDVRSRYRQAFYDFPNLPGDDDTDDEETTAEEVPTEEVPTEEVSTEEVPTEEVSTEEVPTEEVPTEEVPTEEISTPSPATSLPDVIEILSDEEDEVAPTIDSGVDTNSLSKNSTDTVENVSSSSIVRPEIRIKDNSLLDGIDTKTTDVKIIKDLLGYAKPQIQCVNGFTQTDLPRNQDIKVNRGDFTCELMNLKSQLLVYKIPLVIKNGQFNVCYTFDGPPKKTTNKHYWKDLTVIDITKPAAPQANQAKRAASNLQIVPSVTSAAPAVESQPRPSGAIAEQPSRPRVPTVEQQPHRPQVQSKPPPVLVPMRIDQPSRTTQPCVVPFQAQQQFRQTPVVTRPNVINAYAASLVSGNLGTESSNENNTEEVQTNIRVKSVWELR